MKRDRKFWFSQMYEVKDVGGVLVTMYVLKDLTNTELAMALTYYTEREDYEYCAALVAEAELRGITLISKINSK